MSSTTIRIIAAVLDTEKLVLYKEDGETMDIPQGDPRVAKILDQASDPIAEQGWADVDITELADPDSDVYREFENLVRGAIRFFRVHRSKLTDLFDQIVEDGEETSENATEAPHLQPAVIGVVPNNEDDPASTSTPTPTPTPIPAPSIVSDATTTRKPSQKEAIGEIMANAQPVSDPKFRASDTTEEHTMIAAVSNDEGGEDLTIVPGIEHLELQLRHAVKLGSTEGATNFVRRLAAVIDKRRHTIDELLNFMSRGDLPIADDGSIVAYKVLKSHGAPKGKFVDCHTGKVVQQIGSYVTQANVDESRRTQCSTGLHIARRGYLRGFSGDIITMVKVNPEDVIAVPQGEPDKMRARGYHILFNIPANEHYSLRANKPLEGSEAKKMLTMALRGQHIGVIEEVAIGGARGTDVKITPAAKLDGVIQKAPKPKNRTPETEAIDVDAKREQAPAVDPKATSDRVVQKKQASTEQRQLFEKKNWVGLYDFKKAKKKGWSALGFSATEEKTILANDPSKAETKVKTPAKKAPAKKTAPKKATKPAAKKEADLSNMTRREKAEHLAALADNPKLSKAKRQQAFQDLIEHKKSSKVGWGTLGIKNFDALQTRMENI
ncbi:MAG: putative protein rIIB [Prokaryotic dsDNA virus sp.]|jgi:hypothetical protein|nr:MAG: putative protein rIIB [Prokaryotic dsDNA virus sp.]|tara:strand:- start:12029 stop:13852 length:1824 start_codon:yes stop_codon:yes gene_type:complete